jgi:hypothetical protein
MKLRRVSTAFAIACLAVSTSPARATAAGGSAPPLDLSGAHVIRYEPPGPLNNTTRMIIQGQVVKDGCRFSITQTMPTGTARVAQYELARDLDTCVSLVERGTPADTSGAAINAPAAVPNNGCPPGEFLDPGQPVAYPQNCFYTCKGNASTSAVHCTTLTLHAYFRDPFRIQVVQAFDTIAWYWPPDPSCIVQNNVARNSGWDSHQEFPDGWSLNSHSFSTTAYPDSDGVSAECKNESTSSVFTWDNSGFCNLINPLGALTGSNKPVLAQLNPTTVTGNQNGTGTIQITPSLTGSCSGLLGLDYDVQQLVDDTTYPDYGTPGYPDPCVKNPCPPVPVV